MKRFKSTGWLLLLLAIAGMFFLSACDPEEAARKMRERAKMLKHVQIEEGVR